MADQDYTSSVALYLLAGMKAELWIPVDTSNNFGAFPFQDSYKVGGVDKELKNGFYVENENAGEIVESATKKVAVTYLHKKAEKNAIWFISADGETKVVFNIISVPIHDHSSIVQGGPAYGTYFSDTEVD